MKKFQKSPELNRHILYNNFNFNFNFLSRFSMCLTPLPPPPPPQPQPLLHSISLVPLHVFPLLPTSPPPPHAPSSSSRCLPSRVNSIRYFSLCSRLTLYTVQSIFFRNIKNGPLEGRFITLSRNIIVRATLKETVSSVRWFLAHSIIYLKMILDLNIFGFNPKFAAIRSIFCLLAYYENSARKFLAYSQNTHK